MNFFGWLRDGVRQSVLLGVSDAVEQLGTPSEDKLNPGLAGILKLDSSPTATPKIGGPRKKASTNTRKRLGKSLKDIGGAD